MREARFPKDGVFKYFFISLFIAIAALTFWVTKPFLNALLASAVVAYVFFPAYQWLNRHIKYKNVCAAIVSGFILLLFIGPLFLVIESAAPDARFVYVRAKQKILTGELIEVKCSDSAQSILCRLQDRVKEIVQQPDVKYYLSDVVGRVTTFIMDKISGLVLALPVIFLNLFVTFFAVFYLLRDGKALVANIKGLLPIHPKHREHIFKRLQDTARAVIFGSLVVAVIQGVLGGLGFLVFGVSSPLLWGFVMALFALVPFVGTAVIWLPAGVAMIAAGSTEGNVAAVWKGIGLLLYGFFIVSGIDNVLKPMLIGDRSGIHPVLILIGVFGGLAMFGFIGFIIGPLIVAMFKVFLDIYKQEYEEV
ncbi:MAG: AI-2E family transporter [Candidatus Woesearchaeota archaeon]